MATSIASLDWFARLGMVGPALPPAHAGAGAYALDSAFAQKKGEFAADTTYVDSAVRALLPYLRPYRGVLVLALLALLVASAAMLALPIVGGPAVDSFCELTKAGSLLFIAALDNPVIVIAIVLAVASPRVLASYRLTFGASLIAALVNAVQNGKKVLAVVELAAPKA